MPATRNPAADLLVSRATALHNGADPATAESLCRQALALGPEHPAALQMLGLLMRKRGELDEAESLLRRSLRSEPAQPVVWNNLGNLLAAAQRNDEALAAFGEAVRLDPRLSEGHYNLARVLHRVRRTADALAALERALGTVAQPTGAMLQLRGTVLAELGQLDLALAATDAALLRAPTHAALHHNKATILQRRHRPAEALKAHEHAQALGLDAADAHYNHGNTLQSLGRHEAALAAYRRALAREPLHALTLCDLARLRWRLGDASFDEEQAGAATTPAQWWLRATPWVSPGLCPSDRAENVCSMSDPSPAISVVRVLHGSGRIPFKQRF
jgi:tetratricopeptide (TPR) repeat protein